MNNLQTKEKPTKKYNLIGQVQKSLKWHSAEFSMDCGSLFPPQAVWWMDLLFVTGSSVTNMSALAFKRNLLYCKADGWPQRSHVCRCELPTNQQQLTPLVSEALKGFFLEALSVCVHPSKGISLFHSCSAWEYFVFVRNYSLTGQCAVHFNLNSLINFTDKR